MKPNKNGTEPSGGLEKKIWILRKIVLYLYCQTLKQNTMDKFFLLPYVKDSFNPDELLGMIKRFNSYESWGINRTEKIGDRGLLLHVRKINFVGYILITFDGNFVVRKVNKCGMVMMTNNTKYVSILKTIFDLYLAD